MPKSENKTQKLRIKSVKTIQTCVSKTGVGCQSNQSAKILNADLADLMSKLSIIMSKKGDNMRARVYKRAEETIHTLQEDITNIDMLKNKPNIGPQIMQKMKEYVETGTLQLLEREKQNPENILSDVYGIGPQKAKELVQNGITNIDQLREKQDIVLNNVQRIGLKYYDDILQRIPRDEIDKYNTVFADVIQNLSGKPKMNYEIVGSYRRGLTTSGDIDVIITTLNVCAFDNFLDELIRKNLIVEVLSRGKSKCLVIMKLPRYRTARRVDFLLSTPTEYPFSVLYFTGSKSFNYTMRAHALRMGFSMNEHGMIHVSDKQPVDRVFDNERSIFDFLQLQYKTPEERIDGRAVVTRPEYKQSKLEEANIIENVVDKTQKTQKTQKNIIKKPRVENSGKTKKVKNKKIQISEQSTYPLSDKIESNTTINTNLISNTIQNDVKIIAPSNVIMDNIQLFKENGISVLENMDEKTLSAILQKCNDAYYNSSTPVLTDNEYDIIKEFIEVKFPNANVLNEIGAPVSGKTKVKLPYEMASMDKIKPDSNALVNWTTKYNGPYVLSCKLDGVSGLYTTENKQYKLYTRGNGIIGQDISYLLSNLNLPKTAGYSVRGEFIIQKNVFNSKYKDTFANSRNLVSGIINSKKIDNKINDLHFVAYEIIHPPMKPSDQMDILNKLGFETVRNTTVAELTNSFLSDVLLDWRANYDYEIDGVIVTDNKIYPRKSGNPDHAFAFKMVISDQVAEAKVVDVIWSPSKNGLLKPRVRIEPIKLGGVTIEYATGFNGKFIEDNKIGIGAIITMIRSGDVIPFIKSVSVPAEHAKMPDVPYTWTSTHVDVVISDISEDPTVKQKNITGFFTILNVDGLSIGNVKRIYNAGYDSISKILQMSVGDFEKIDGFKSKMAEKIHNSIHSKIKEATLLDIMVASNKLGRGLGARKIAPILEKYPTILLSSESDDAKIALLKTVPGIGKENAAEFVKNIPDFLYFLNECKLEYKLHSGPVLNVPTGPENTGHPLYGKKIVMTKTRDKHVIDALKQYGSIISDNITTDTYLLIVKSKTDESNKMDYAVKHNITIMTPEEFINKYVTITK